MGSETGTSLPLAACPTNQGTLGRFHRQEHWEVALPERTPWGRSPGLGQEAERAQQQHQLWVPAGRARKDPRPWRGQEHEERVGTDRALQEGPAGRAGSWWG